MLRRGEESGCVAHAEFVSAATLSVLFQPIDVRSNPDSAIPFLSALPYQGTNLTIWARLVVLEIEVGEK